MPGPVAHCEELGEVRRTPYTALKDSPMLRTNAGGGQPGYFGSGSASNANNIPGSGGYVMLHLMR